LVVEEARPLVQTLKYTTFAKAGVHGIEIELGIIILLSYCPYVSASVSAVAGRVYPIRGMSS
jgi:hypothetical protein